ncbi:MAG: hypothetical protein IT365_14840 [Candidatus Hydrogenedentes bacterium]|nr:hypothetical protein [Candidatus Hydrogenedentota bacterium]
MTTDIHLIRDATLKGFGLYCLAYAVVAMLSQTVPLLLTLDLPLVAWAASLFVNLSYAALGYLCVFRTHTITRAFWREEETETMQTPLSTLTVVVSLVGVYFLIHTAGLVMYFAWEARHPRVYSVATLIGTIAALAFALSLVRQAGPLARFIQKRG